MLFYRKFYKKEDDYYREILLRIAAERAAHTRDTPEEAAEYATVVAGKLIGAWKRCCVQREESLKGLEEET